MVVGKTCSWLLVLVMQVRGKGLLNAIVMEPYDGIGANAVCAKLKEAGLLVSFCCICLQQAHVV